MEVPERHQRYSTHFEYFTAMIAMFFSRINKERGTRLIISAANAVRCRPSISAKWRAYGRNTTRRTWPTSAEKATTFNSFTVSMLFE